MNLFRDSNDVEAYGQHLTELLITGATQIERLAKPGQKVSFKAWSEAIRQDATQREPSLKDNQLKWLWEALTTEPRMLAKFGDHILSREEEWKAKTLPPYLNKGIN